MNINDYKFAGKKAIVRVDFNVPLDENGKITDDTRIRGALPTLKKVLDEGGSLIIMSHMGKPKGKVNAKYSLGQPVNLQICFRLLSNITQRSILFRCRMCIMTKLETHWMLRRFNIPR